LKIEIVVRKPRGSTQITGAAVKFFSDKPNFCETSGLDGAREGGR
jgi:hypothetical protein